MSRDKTHDRAPDQTTLNVSLSKELKERIHKAAVKDHRTMSSYIVSRIDRIMDEEDAKAKPKADVDLTGVASEFEELFGPLE